AHHEPWRSNDGIGELVEVARRVEVSDLGHDAELFHFDQPIGQHGSHVHHSTGMRRPPVIDEGSSTTKPIRKDAIGLSYHVMNGVVLKVQKCPRREAGAFPMQASTPLASLPSDRESTAGDTDVLSGHDRVAVLVEHRQTVL